MFAAKNGGQSPWAAAGVRAPFTTVGDVTRHGQRSGHLPPGAPERLRLLLIATLHGIAALVTSGRARAWQADTLITDAVAHFTCGQH
jgi:hypothetical protein